MKCSLCGKDNEATDICDDCLVLAKWEDNYLVIGKKRLKMDLDLAIEHDKAEIAIWAKGFLEEIAKTFGVPESLTKEIVDDCLELLKKPPVVEQAKDQQVFERKALERMVDEYVPRYVTNVSVDETEIPEEYREAALAKMRDNVEKEIEALFSRPSDMFFSTVYACHVAEPVEPKEYYRPLHINILEALLWW